MKKKIIIIAIIWIILGVGVFLFLKDSNKEKTTKDSKYNDKLSSIITSNSWERDGGGDTEHISFNKNGNYVYYCSCGEPVGNSDLYDLYAYDKETNTIKVYSSYDKKEYELIKIKEVDELKLVLDFDGAEKTFYSKEGVHLANNPLPIAGREYKTKSDIRIEFKNDGSFESYDNKNGGFTYFSDICFTWTYNEEMEMIYLNCNDDKTRKIKLKNYDPENPDGEIVLYMIDDDPMGIFTPVK